MRAPTRTAYAFSRDKNGNLRPTLKAETPSHNGGTRGPSNSVRAFKRHDFDNCLFKDLKIETRTYIRYVFDTFHQLMPDSQNSQHRLPYTSLEAALGCLGADSSQAEMLMVRKLYHLYTRPELIQCYKDEELSFTRLSESAKRRRWGTVQFQAIAAVWMKDKNEEVVVRQNEKVLAAYELRAKKAATAAKEKIGRPPAMKEKKEKPPFKRWEEACETAFLSKAEMTQFPFPELSQCANKCLDFTQARVCQHNVGSFFRSSENFSPQLLKKYRNILHPDMFECCREDRKDAFKEIAKKLFVVICPMSQELEGKEGSKKRHC